MVPPDHVFDPALRLRVLGEVARLLLTPCGGDPAPPTVTDARRRSGTGAGEITMRARCGEHADRSGLHSLLGRRSGIGTYTLHLLEALVDRYPHDEFAATAFTWNGRR